MRKITALLLTIAMLTGCSSSSSGIKDAAALLKEYISEEHENMTMKGTIEEDISEDDIMIPVTIETTVDMYEDYAHGNTTITTMEDDDSYADTCEIYTVGDDSKATAYIKYDGDDAWTEIDAKEDSIGFMLEVADLQSDTFKDATFEQKDGQYIVTETLKNVESANDDLDFAEVFTDLDLPDDALDLMKDEMESCKFTYVFDQDSLDLLSITMDDFSFDDEVTYEDDETVDLKLNLKLSFEFSNFNNIKEEDVKMPDDLDIACI